MVRPVARTPRVSASIRLRAIGLGALLACALGSSGLSSCLPLDDLSTHTIGSGRVDAGRFDLSPAPDADPSLEAADASSRPEELGEPLPLVPPADAGALTGSEQPATDAASPLACEGEGEFESPDGQSCYRSTADIASWFGARAACLEWGGDLVSIESPQEDEFLSERVRVEVWIGANDLDVEGSYVWADGTPVEYENWSVAQPDNFQGQEDCVEKRVEDGAWNDRPCGGDDQEYVCER